MKKRISNEDREIYLMELFWYVLGKWKWILAGIVIGAILLGGFGVYKDYKNSHNNKVQSTEEILEAFSEPRQELILSAVELNKTYKKMNENINTNYLMKLNPDNLVKATLQYYVDTEYKVNLAEDIETDYTAELIEMYVLMVDNNEVSSEIMELDIKNLEINDIDYIVVTSVNEGIFKVVVCADEGDCEKITEVIKEHINRNYKTVTESIGEHKISLVGENYSYTYSDYIRNAQTTRRNLLKTYSDNLTSAKKLFTSDELAAYNRIAEESNADVSEFKFSINSKYLILGIIGGAFAVVFIAVLVYMFGSRIRSLSEVGQVYHIDLVGKLALRQNVFSLKRNKLSKGKDIKAQVEYIVKTIKAECTVKGIQTVMLCTSIKPEEQVINEITKELKGLGINAEYGEAIDTDANTLEKVTQSGNCILIEQIDVSERKSIETEIEICDRLNINILGMIVII